MYLAWIAFCSIKSYQSAKKTMMQEMKEYLIKEGYHPEKPRGRDILIFKREGLSFVYYNRKREEKFLSIALPNIWDVTHDSRFEILEAANKINQTMSVGKVFVIDDSVWCTYERFLTSQDSLDEICSRALDMLVYARMEFYDILEKRERERKGLC